MHEVLDVVLFYFKVGNLISGELRTEQCTRVFPGETSEEERRYNVSTYHALPSEVKIPLPNAGKKFPRR